MSREARVVIAVPVVAHHTDASESLVKRAARLLDLGVTDVESHAEALIIVREGKALKKRILAGFKEPCELAHRTWKSFTALRAKFTDPIDAMVRKADAEASRYSIAEEQRAEREAKAQADKLRQQQLAEAQMEAEAAEDPVEAEEILVAAETAPDPEVLAEPAVATVKGMHGTRRWSTEVEDKLMVLAYVLDNPEHLNGIDVSMKYWNKLAQAQQKRLKIPGLKVVSKLTSTSKG